MVRSHLRLPTFKHMRTKIIQIVDKIQDWRKNREISKKKKILLVNGITAFNSGKTYYAGNREWSFPKSTASIDRTSFFN